MIHVALCLLAVILAWWPDVRSTRETKTDIRTVATLYAAVQVFFWWAREPAKFYGENWWALVAAVETITAVSLIGVRHWSGRWVRLVSWSAVAINLSCIPLKSPIFSWYPYLIPCSEFARAAGIIIASGPVWHPLQRWYARRQTDKDSTWLARLEQIPR